jgi:hypothetical protein
MTPRSDWCCLADYEYLYELDASELAWEFLRRNPDYQRDYLASTDDGEASAKLWGLRFPCGSGTALGSGLANLVAAPRSSGCCPRSCAGIL